MGYLVWLRGRVGVFLSFDLGFLFVLVFVGFGAFFVVFFLLFGFFGGEFVVVVDWLVWFGFLFF